jgi:hypothetical protein
MSLSVPQPIAAFFESANKSNAQALTAQFASDAFVSDRHRLYWGIQAIGKWSESDIVGARVSFRIAAITEHYGETIVTAIVSGGYEKVWLSEGPMLALYFKVRADKIDQLIVLPILGYKPLPSH